MLVRVLADVLLGARSGELVHEVLHLLIESLVFESLRFQQHFLCIAQELLRRKDLAHGIARFFQIHMLRHNLAHRLLHALQILHKVPVEGLLRLFIELFIFLEQSLLRAQMIARPARACNPTLLRSLASRTLWRDRTYLLNNFGPRVYLINHGEEARYLCLMAWHDLQLIDEVLPLRRTQQGQLVDIVAIAQVIHFQSVLLKLECFQQLVDGYLGELHVHFLVVRAFFGIA